MKEAVFKEAQALCQKRVEAQEEVTSGDASALGVALPSLQSLRRQMFTRYIRRVAAPYMSRPEVKEDYIQRWRAGESVESLARSARYSPYLLARVIVEAQCCPGARAVVELMRNPALIEDARLAADVRACVARDADYSPAVDTIKATVGLEYEARLSNALRARGVPFVAESAARARGLAKTPDALLLVPMAVRDGEGGWRVVTWIDSKAMFGYPDAFEEQLTQLHSYVNRYGPGMVVYWLDHVDSLNAPRYRHRSADIYVASAFPAACDIMLPDDPEEGGGAAVTAATAGAVASSGGGGGGGGVLVRGDGGEG